MKDATGFSIEQGKQKLADGSTNPAVFAKKTTTSVAKKWAVVESSVDKKKKDSKDSNLVVAKPDDNDKSGIIVPQSTVPENAKDTGTCSLVKNFSCTSLFLFWTFPQ